MGPRGPVRLAWVSMGLGVWAGLLAGAVLAILEIRRQHWIDAGLSDLALSRVLAGVSSSALVFGFLGACAGLAVALAMGLGASVPGRARVLRLVARPLAAWQVVPALALAVAAGIGERRMEAAAARRTAGAPSILFVLVDALRPDRLGCHGHPYATSPVIDGLAARGVLFTAAQSPSNVTRTSMPSIWTGLLPSRHGVFDRQDVLAPRFTTLAEILADRGYATAAFCPNPSLDRRFGHDQGWDLYDDGILGRGAEEGDERFETASRINDAFLRWLSASGAVASGRPFLAWLHYRDVHGPYVHEPLPVRAGEPPREPRPLTDQERRALPPYLRIGEGGDDLATYLARYDGGIRHADEQLGRLLDDLDREGRLRNTIVVVTADHGEAFLEHGSWNHGNSLFQEEIHVPLVMAWPAGPWRQGRVTRVVSTLDLFPTLAALAGAAVRPSDGLSLAPLAEGRPDGYARTQAVSEAASTGGTTARALRDGRWKLVSDWGSRSLALFDLESDPGETVNAWTAHREVGDRLWRDLQALALGLGERERPARETLDPDLEERLESLGYVR